MKFILMCYKRQRVHFGEANDVLGNGSWLHPKNTATRITHPLHATLDNRVLDAYESGELGGENH
jgi:hypothetical protein